MAYDPTVPTEGERNNTYYFIWIGALGTAVLISAQLLALPRWIIGLSTLAAAASLLVAILSSRNDDYFRHLTHIASRFAMGAIAIWFFIAAVLFAGDGGYFVGELAAGVTPVGNATSGPAAWFTADVLAIIVTMAFHIRFLIERYRQ
jgi:hypothetical protein